MNDNLTAPPINPLPPVVWLLALPMIAMEILLSLAQRGLVGGANGVGWRLDAFDRFAFVPDLMRRMFATGSYPPEHLMRALTYPFVHLSIGHAMFAVVLVLALGKMVGEIFRPWAVLVVFFGAAIAGAAVYTALPMVQQALIGGYPAAYGLIGAFTFLLWARLAGTGTNQYRAFTMIGFLMGIQLVFGLLFGAGWDWVAELAGFAAGFLLSFVVSPGGWTSVVAKLRRR